jgi:riboflavin synthase
MFTGLVEGQGTVLEIVSLAAGIRLKLMPEAGCFSASAPGLGDSISISGCCLTVVKADDVSLEFEAGEETLSKTSLRHLRVGSRVNLERSLTPASRLGGHFVQGHVDGTAVVHQIQRSHDWVDMWFRTSPELLEMMVTKGSVAVDGVSLTIVHVEPERFSVALIPHTLKMTTLGERQSGDVVNIENDILGKYVARLLSQRFSPGTGSR